MRFYKKYEGYKIKRNDKTVWTLARKIGGFNDTGVYKYKEKNADRILIALENDGKSTQEEFRIFVNQKEYEEFYDRCESRGYTAYHMIMEIAREDMEYFDSEYISRY